ncbi:CHAT domain-containing protein [Microtetraspora sp. NBRC 13810]|uniref:CHAT domain-containing protein n=1 Tax=Microtetraspora sp. NBRC 13810 TaxID=3030990 RepID=UPI0024A33670|nr:CHAT domain-containing protein [Microtetraspora sp. NBRC 13810]GLW06935.1 CHAT domain-containing protein [Microtetraspora sp. NBRC 13810]
MTDIRQILDKLVAVVNDGDRDQVLGLGACADAATLLHAVGTALRGQEGLPSADLALPLHVVGMLHLARYTEAGPVPIGESPDFVTALVLIDLADLCGVAASERMRPFVDGMRANRPGDRDRLLHFTHQRSPMWQVPVAAERIALGLLLYTVTASLSPAQDPALPFLRALMWEHVRAWHQAAGTAEDLGHALLAAREAVATGLPPEGEETAGHLSGLGESAGAYYDVTGDPGLLDEAVTAYRNAVAAAPPGSRAQVFCLGRLCAVLPYSYAETGDVAALAEAADAGARAAQACPPGDPMEAGVLYHYGGVLFSWARLTGNLAEMRRAPDLLRRAVELLPPGDPDRPEWAGWLAVTLRNLYVITSDETFLAEAVPVARQALADAADATAEVRAHCLTHLAGLLEEDYLRRADDEALTESIGLFRQALALLGTATPEERAGAEAGLGSALRNLAVRTGDPAALDEAIALLRAAAAAMRPLDPRYAATVVRLVRAIGYGAAARGGEADLDEAASIAARALDGLPTGSPDHALVLAAYADTLMISSAHRGDTSLLPRAADALEEAVDATPPGDIGRVLNLRSLGAALELRFRITGDATLLAECVRRMRQAVAEGAGMARDAPLLLAGLAGALKMTYEHSGDRAALDEAIEVARAAVAAAPRQDGQRPVSTRELGGLLLMRARETGDPAELDEAVGMLREGQDPVGTSRALNERYTARGDPADLAEALRLLRSTVQNPAGGVRARLSAAWTWGETAAGHERWAEAAEGYAAAVRILPTAVTRRLPRTEQELALRTNAYLGQDAAACALRLGNPAQALELLEYGRGVLFAQALETRSDLDVLTERAPELAERVRRLRELLDAGPGRLESVTAVGLGAERRWRLAAEWEEALGEVRAMGLLTPPHAEELLASVGEDPVVVLNASPYHSDALILRGGRIEVVPLPLLDRSKAAEHAVRFHVAVRYSLKADTTVKRLIGESMIGETLTWLWRAVAKPVLRALGISRWPAKRRPLPRIRWCPTGPLAYLPLHAAARTGWPGVLDLAVSSYTSTVRALAHGRRQRPAPQRLRRPLVVAVGQTPGMADLPATAVEAERIARRVPGAVLLEPPSRERLLAALPDHAWLHFAGHAYADPQRPSRSSLALGADRLTVLDIARLDLPHAELAYLSACQTAAASGAIADEAINLASAFQLAGYEHVIATLWSIRDEEAAHAADHVYGLLDPTALPGDHVAAAVHSASMSLRARHPHRPDLWAALIHTGP